MRLTGGRGAVCTHVPITELKRVEEDLRQSEERFARFMQSTGMIKTAPQKLIAQGTDWRFLNELKKELKA